MSRVSVYRSLPPLAEVIGRAPRFTADKSRQQVVIEELRNGAEKLKTADSQPFYSMREVADFFKVPLTTSARVYKRLEREGIISRIRSSHTVLLGREVFPREAVRGVVGLYIWLHSMILLPYTQTFVIELEEHLRQLGYVADIIFHGDKLEESSPELATRLLRHQLDAVILHSPTASIQQNILSLRERGVRVLVVQRKDTQFDLPAIIYLQDYETAYQKMAARWFEVGIRKVLLCTPAVFLHNKAETNIFKKILGQHGLQVESVPDDLQALLKKLRQRPWKSVSAVAFLDGTHSEQVCNREPQVIEQISRLARLAFCVGPIRVPHLRFKKVCADIIDFSPTEIAATICEDVSRLSIMPDGISHTFVAHYYEQAPF